METAIWLTEVAPHTKPGKRITDHLAAANRDANPELMRLALKLATGAGKTTVMAMLIAWQTVNAVRRPGSKLFTHGFLVCTPGLAIKDRLTVLQPNDPHSYCRERIELSAGGRALLKGRRGEALDTLETEGRMLQRVMPDLMGMKNILAINDDPAPRHLATLPEAKIRTDRGEGHQPPRRRGDEGVPGC